MNGRFFRVAVVMILLLATGLRLYRLDHQSFWNDEGNTARLTERSPQLIIEGTASDVHPPLYYLLLHVWRQGVGQSEWGLRYFSAVAGILTVAAVIGFSRLFFNQATALMAGLLTALSPPLIYYSQEARMYSLLALWSVLATGLLVWGLERSRWPNEKSSWSAIVQLFKKGWVIGYVGVAAAGLYTHYSFPAVLLAHIIGVAVWLFTRPNNAGRGIKVVAWVAIWGAIGVLYLPWLPIFLGASGRAAAPELASDFWVRAAQWVWVGPTGQLPLSGALTAGVCLIGAGWTVSRRGWDRGPLARVVLQWGLVAVLPIIFIFLVGATAATFLKFLTMAVPGMMIVAAVGLVGLGGWVGARLPFAPLGGRVLVSCGLLLLLLIPLGQSLNRLYFDPATYRADYRALAAQIEALGHPNAGILLNAPNQWEVFTYYYDGPAPVYPFPRFVMPAADVYEGLSKIGQNHERLYAIFWGADGFDPDGVTESWMGDNGFKVIDEFRGDLRYVVMALPKEGQLQDPQPLDLAVGPDIILRAAALPSAEVRPGDVIQIVLTWETQSQLGERYKLFLHLVNEQGDLVAQRDSEPAGNLRPTTTWQVGEAIEDRHGLLLPLDAPAGHYSLLVGLYDINRPAKRLAISAPHLSGDAVEAWPLWTFDLLADPINKKRDDH